MVSKSMIRFLLPFGSIALTSVTPCKNGGGHVHFLLMPLCRPKILLYRKDIAQRKKVREP